MPRRSRSGQLDLLGGGQIVEVPIEERLQQAFLDYAMSVIVGRALPDVRDGLKPVQRRILYTMWETRLLPDRPYRKSAAVVGEVMKKYHPHGDAAIYDALVRMAQDFSSREPLVDGHGNFGSIDDDPPAAMRYTEVRLSPLAMEMLAGIDEDTVDFVPNYDGYEREPVVLPARFPNLLVNGATGIAVGMATNIPPHNLGEVIDALLHLIRHPDATIDDLMRFVPGPDFPTGARILDTDGIREAMATGRGAITVEAVATTEVRTGNLPRIVITEIPYGVNKRALLERIAGLVERRQLDAVRDLRDESSRDGMRIVVELKRGEDPAAVLEQLYRRTELRTNFNVNFVALVDGAPRTLGFREALAHYLEHQRQVITRRTEHRLAKARDRAHVLEGLLTALDHLDEVISLIRRSPSAEQAKTRLVRRFELTERQAQAVLDMQLRRLAALERAELEDEYQQLLARIAELEAVLADETVRDQVLIEELEEIKRVHATPRRSRIVPPTEHAAEVLAEDVFEAQPVTVYVTAGGYLKVVPRRRTSPAHSHPHDPLVAVLRTTTDARLLLVDAAGTGYRVDVADLPVGQPRHRGVPAAQLLGDPPAAPLVGAVPLRPDTTLVTVTAAGRIKRTTTDELDTRTRTGPVAGLKDGDELVAVTLCGDDDHLLLAHSGGQVIRFPAADVRPMGRTAAGVVGMKVPRGARIVSVSALPGGSDDLEVATVGADGHAKRSSAGDYPTQGRGGKGVQAGVAPLVYCGRAVDLHLLGEEARVVRPVDLPQARRTAAGTDLGVRPSRVVAELSDED